MQESNTAFPLLAFTRLSASDCVGSRANVSSSEHHLNEALAWLIRAQDKTADGGVSYGYSLRGGWRESYVETTGYIATTFFDLAAALSRPELADRAVRMTDWLCSMQRPDGSFTNARFAQDSGIVFDTGQDLFGLVRAYRETNHDRYASAANRAADWLVCHCANEAGRWTRNTHMGIPHVYNSRVAWALLQVNQLWPKTERERVARANLDWAVTQERNGWFDNCAFVTGKAPFTHTIAYAIRGLWESAAILDDARYRDCAVRAATAVAAKVDDSGFLPGQFETDGSPVGSYCCLTGNCQLAIIWMKIFNQTGDIALRDAAVRALQFVMSTQDISGSNPDVRGAIKGSYPIWGRYAPFSYPNWAAKFFIDAIAITESELT
jgi:uncharacterized protein YyaL (SSP411 family)